jgi:acylphosphatase
MSDAGAEQRTRKRAIYHGQVQGVFFRATTREISRGYNVVGFVRNLPDGSVHLEAEGPPDQVQEFLSEVGARFRENISRTDEATVEPQGRESGFDIRY